MTSRLPYVIENESPARWPGLSLQQHFHRLGRLIRPSGRLGLTPRST